jgi:hypothetical protein
MDKNVLMTAQNDLSNSPEICELQLEGRRTHENP